MGDFPWVEPVLLLNPSEYGLPDHANAVGDGLNRQVLCGYVLLYVEVAAGALSYLCRHVGTNTSPLPESCLTPIWQQSA